MDEDERRARLEALYVAHARTVLLYARRRTDHATAADVLSDVFVVAWQRLDEVPTDALPWLLACARRVLWHQQRAERRRFKLVEHLTANTPRTPLSVELHDDALAQAFATLSERNREVLLLTAWEGLSAKQPRACSAAHRKPSGCALIAPANAWLPLSSPSKRPLHR